MTKLHGRYLQALAERKKNFTFRSLQSIESGVDFLSNDYLGLARLELNQQLTSENPGSSRLIAGTTKEHLQLEEQLAHFFHAPSALLYNSGYMANIGVLATLTSKDDIILYDELAHASIKDGLRLTYASSFKFKHNDTEDLTRLLKKFNNQQVFVVVEGLYSMDGDFVHLDILATAQAHQAQIIIDEAHSAGTVGVNGIGKVTQLSEYHSVIAKIVTFGKAFGAHGAVVLTSPIIKDYLINFSRSFIYTTALPRSVIKRLQYIFSITDLHDRQQQLQQNIDYFRSQCQSRTIMSEFNSPIQAIMFNEVNELLRIEAELKKYQIGVKSILSPTVKKGTERLRISLHSFNNFTEIDTLCKVLNE